MSEQLPSKTKILFIIPDLYSGGAQRVFTNLIKGFSRERFEITLITLIKPKDEHYKRLIPADVRFIQYNFQNTKAAFFTLVSLIRKENPQVVFSTLTHLNFILSIAKFFVSSSVLFVARESSIISSSLKDEKQTFLFRFFYGRIYRNFNLIICQSKAMAVDLVKNFKIKESLIKIIHNPVDFDHIFECIALGKKTRSNSQRVELLCVGRLDPPKGYDRLLKVLDLVKSSGFDFRLRIVGDGSLRENLIKSAKELELLSYVEFLGMQENPFQFMAESDCLLLTSYYEGLPNVVLESNGCGLPVIAFDAPGGIAEVIEDGVTGWLVKDGDLHAFASRIQSKEYLKVDRQRIIKFVTEKFSLSAITSQYERAILSLSDGTND